jgi:hypothetical protein
MGIQGKGSANMRKTLIAATVAAAFGLPAAAASLSVAGLLDGEDGTALNVDARLPLGDAWSVSAGAGKGESNVEGSEFSGTTLRASADVNVGGFGASLALQRWKDSSQLESASVRGQMGWTTDAGWSFSALVDDRRLTIDYSFTGPQGVVREAEVEFNGTGLGADVSWFGEQWNAGVRFLDYDYGRSMDRVQAALNAPTTTRAPRVQLLANSIVTRAAGAPEREISATLGRQFSRSSLQGDWVLQRDALSGTDVNSLSLTHGYEISRHVEVDTTLGFSDGGAGGTIAFAGLALTLRN